MSVMFSNLTQEKQECKRTARSLESEFLHSSMECGHVLASSLGQVSSLSFASVQTLLWVKEVPRRASHRDISQHFFNRGLLRETMKHYLFLSLLFVCLCHLDRW